MPIGKLNPYIIFNGTAESAIKLYESALGAKTENISRYGDVPGAKITHTNLVMHAALHIGEGIVMISDAPPDRPVPVESNVEIALHFSEPDDMTKLFEALAAGGKVKMPIQDTFWGAKFGMLADAYGVSWMFNCTIKQG
jgi:PhnB protein